MQSVISNLDGVDLHLEYLVLNQIGVQSLPFVGMDSKSSYPENLTLKAGEFLIFPIFSNFG